MKLTSREIVGIILWWAEGSKSRHDKRWKNARSYPIELTNTNPLIIKTFLDFLRFDLHIDESRLRLQLQIHEGDDKESLEQFWSELTLIPIERFNKTIIRPIGKKVGKSKGTCKVRLADKILYGKLEALLEQVLFELQEEPGQSVEL